MHRKKVYMMIALLALLLTGCSTAPQSGEECKIQAERVPAAATIPGTEKKPEIPDTAETEEKPEAADQAEDAEPSEPKEPETADQAEDAEPSEPKEPEAADSSKTEKKPEPAGEAVTGGLTETPAAAEHSGTASRKPELAEEVFGLVNGQRAEAGLSELVWENALAEAAQIRAEELAVKFSHTRPDGSQGSDIAGAVFSGENLASTEGSLSTAAHVADQWNKSGMHRDNMLCADFTRAGAAVYETAEGRMYWVIIFAGD